MPSQITKRLVKGAPLTHTEMDTNFEAVVELQDFSSSFSNEVTADSASFSERITNLSSSVIVMSSSFQERITNDSSSFEDRITFLTSSLVTISSSLQNRITVLSSSLQNRITTNSSSFESRISFFEDINGLVSGSSQIDHDLTKNFVSDEHINHRIVDIIAGAGLTGGGQITGSFTLAVGQGTGITVNANDIALDTTNSRNINHSAVSILAGNGLTGGGTIAADRTLSVVGGTGVTVNGTGVNIGQPVGTGDSVTFAQVSSTGDVIAYSTSDRRFKDNLKTIDNSLEKVNKLNGYEFDWNDNQDVYEGHDFGVIAQEVEEVFPELVQTRENGYKAVKYEKLIPSLIEAIKELTNKVKELESKVGE